MGSRAAKPAAHTITYHPNADQIAVLPAQLPSPSATRSAPRPPKHLSTIGQPIRTPQPRLTAPGRHTAHEHTQRPLSSPTPTRATQLRAESHRARQQILFIRSQWTPQRPRGDTSEIGAQLILASSICRSLSLVPHKPAASTTATSSKTARTVIRPLRIVLILAMCTHGL
jgi:hypothetical protein